MESLWSNSLIIIFFFLFFPIVFSLGFCQDELAELDPGTSKFRMLPSVHDKKDTCIYF